MTTTNTEIGAFINAQTEDTTPDGAADFVLTYDADAGAVKKVKLENMPVSAEGYETGDIRQVELYRNEIGVGGGNWDVSSIAQTYDHLLIRVAMRSSVVANGDEARLFFNNDTTGSNYAYAIDYAAGAPNTGAEAKPCWIAGASDPANSFSEFEILIPWYASTTRNKNAIVKGGRYFAASPVSQTHNNYMEWKSTAAINRITIQPDGYATDKFVQYSMIQIIGIKTTA